MKLWSRLKSNLGNLFCGFRVENQLDDEIRAERIAAGVSVIYSRRIAQVESGTVEQMKQPVCLIKISCVLKMNGLRCG